ncbi:MAG: hypothetical protein EXS05_02225 [Planctomycetaceae bacterium]|nr:hypothetical protein [Planctomycetaceae bacterium]
MLRLFASIAISLIFSAYPLAAEDKAVRLCGALLTGEMASPMRLGELRNQGYDAVVLSLDGDSFEARQADRSAAVRIAEAGFELWYWIEIARCRQLADDHPHWMASLQGHQEWRRFFKEFPKPQPGEVVKNYPWVPIVYRETFDAQLARVQELLAARPAARGILLNDLQGAPSACGCGNPVCRWTADYGPIKTATPLGDDAAARFVAAVEKTCGKKVQVIPVWTTECEAHDVHNDALCAGVSCFKGICWKAYCRQLQHLDEQSPTIGALLLYKEFGQDTKNFPQPAGWVSHALRGFQTMPPQNSGKAIAASRLLAVLQGWDVSPDELAAQQKQVQSVGAAGWVVAFARIDQSWTPRIVPAK